MTTVDPNNNHIGLTQRLNQTKTENRPSNDSKHMETQTSQGQLADLINAVRHASDNIHSKEQIEQLKQTIEANQYKINHEQLSQSILDELFVMGFNQSE